MQKNGCNVENSGVAPAMRLGIALNELNPNFLHDFQNLSINYHVFELTDNSSSYRSPSGTPEVEYKVRAAVCHHSRSEGRQGDRPGSKER